MDYRKINSHIVLLLIVFIVGLTIAMLSRLIVLDKGFDAGTANLTFIIIFGACIIGYLIILGTLAHTVIPWIMKKLPKKKSIPVVIQNTISDETIIKVSFTGYDENIAPSRTSAILRTKRI
ncbi:MAG: hypothetical protein LBF62_01395 [Tannerellaceae bacterium]|jgi:hypothetical protein|nr:hypothetical protein [Tannerellaceae bacterium]